MFIEKAQFLKLFDSFNLTYDEFKEKTIVQSFSKQIQLEKYIKSNDIVPLYQHLTKKDEYLNRFYNTSLKFDPNNISIKEDPMKLVFIDNNKHVKYKNIIRNMHYNEILRNTKSGLKNNPTFLDVLLDLYNNNIIDYKLLTPSAIYYTKEGRIGSVFSSFYFRASILNPYLIYSINENLLNARRVFTPTLGWSSYCYGFLESSQTIEYVGTDVISSVCRKTKSFAKYYYPNKDVKIYCCPSEYLLSLPEFYTNYFEHFDTVFFSPPYYKLELYSGNNQSTTNYSSYQDWLDKYWEKTMKLCHYVLQKGGILCYIISGYGKDLEYNLQYDMNLISSKYFNYLDTIPMSNKNVHVTTHRYTNENIVLFKK